MIVPTSLYWRKGLKLWRLTSADLGAAGTVIEKARGQNAGGALNKEPSRKALDSWRQGA